MTVPRMATVGAAALGAALIVLAALLPKAAERLTPASAPDAPLAAGAFHVHTIRSDGSGTVDEAAAAASRAGLRFVIFTDHGDATRQPDPPAYRSGVLCIDGVEISTTGGHYAAIGLPRAPYPLGGAPRDAVEDVRRLGGFGVVTHPDSAKGKLAWTAWDQPFDAIEWLNADSEWRDEGPARLAAAVLTYPFRGPETIAALFDRPATLRRWDQLAGRRRVIALAGSDAHARIAWRRETESSEGRLPLRIPSYEASFRAFSLHVGLDRPLAGNAREDAAALLAAIRAGRVHTVVEAFARPGVLDFKAVRGEAVAREGDVVPLGGEVVVMHVRCNGPAGTRLVLFRDGREVSRATSRQLVHATNRAGAYRAEAWLPGRADPPMPWAVSNPIFVGEAFSAERGEDHPAVGATVAAIAAGAEGWHVEHDQQSAGELSRRAEAVTLRYGLGRGPGRSQFAALAVDGRLPPTAAGLAFTGTSAGPMRVSVQVRVPGRGDGERWLRSVYLDSAAREVVVPFADMRAAGLTTSASPRAGEVGTILFVVDRTHAVAGGAGEFSVSNVRVMGSR